MSNKECKKNILKIKTLNLNLIQNLALDNFKECFLILPILYSGRFLAKEGSVDDKHK